MRYKAEERDEILKNSDLEINAALKNNSMKNNAPGSGVKGGKFGAFVGKHAAGLSIAASLGSIGLNSLAGSANENGNKSLAGWLGTGSMALTGLSLGLHTGNPIIAAIGAALGAVVGFV